MRHEIEERRSKALRREEDGNARDADLRIDLESGFVNITAPPAAPAADDADDKPSAKVTPTTKNARRS